MSFERTLRFAAIQGSPLQDQTFLTYALIITIPLGILSSKYYFSSRESVSEFARQNLYSIVKQNNEIIDAELARVEESSLALIAEQVLYEQYLHANPGTNTA